MTKLIAPVFQALMLVTIAVVFGACASTNSNEVYRATTTVSLPEPGPWVEPSIAAAESALKQAGYQINHSSAFGLEASLIDSSMNEQSAMKCGAERRITLSIDRGNGLRVSSKVVVRFLPLIGKHPFAQVPEIIAQVRQDEATAIAALSRTNTANR